VDATVRRDPRTTHRSLNPTTAARPNRDPKWKSRTDRPITHARAPTKIIRRRPGRSRIGAVDPGSACPEHMQAYFDEWVFRFNRRNARSRGLLFQRILQQAAEGDALTYKELRKAGRTRPPPPPPGPHTDAATEL